MSMLIKNLGSSQVLSVYRALRLIQAKRNCHWFPDYKPGPVPKTEEERIAAAKKYNLLPEEYESFEEGEGYGDYPKLPYESVDSRDPWYYWDNEELRKNFNEPVNIRIINCLPEADSTGPLRISHWKGLFYFFAITGSCFAVLLALDQFEHLQIACNKQYPVSGAPHYTFEADLEEAERRATKKYVCRELGKGESAKEGETPGEDICP